MKRFLCFSITLLLLCLRVSAAGEEKIIYLTFDDGPGPYTARLLDTLQEEGVQATFFVTGKAAAYPELLRRMADEGHTIALHSYCHDYNTIYASEDAFFRDIEDLESLIFEETGLHPKLLRFPGGSSNTVSCFNPGIMTRLCASVTERGYCYVDWHVDSRDSVGCRTTEGVLRNMQDGAEQWGDCIILQHDIYSYSVDAVQSFIRWGKERGYGFAALTTDAPHGRHNVYN